MGREFRTAISLWRRTALGLSLLVATLGGSLLVTPGAVGAAPAAPPSVARMQKTGTNMCLVVRGNVDGAPAVQTPCAGFADQHWFNNPVGSFFQIQNANSGKCLVARGSTAPVVQTLCNSGFADQVWKVLQFAGGDYQIESRRYPLSCIVVRSLVNGAQAVLTQCDPQFVDQRWAIQGLD